MNLIYFLTVTYEIFNEQTPFIAGGKTGYGCLLSIQNKRYAEPHGGGLGIRES